MSNIQEAIGQAKGMLTQSKDRITHLLNETPDDRINWSPSPTSRTPVQIVAHSAHAVFNINEMLDGRPFQVKTTPEAEVFFKEYESQFSSREQVLELLEKNCSNYINWLDNMTPEVFAGQCTGPFGMGDMPIAVSLNFPALHMMGHIAQIEYIQTILGDRDWHF